MCPASDAVPEAAGPYGSSRTGSISPTACSRHSRKPWFTDPVSPTVAPYLPSTDYISDDLWSALAYAAAATGALCSSYFMSRAQMMRVVLLASATVTSIRGFEPSSAQATNLPAHHACWPGGRPRYSRL